MRFQTSKAFLLCFMCLLASSCTSCQQTKKEESKDAETTIIVQDTTISSETTNENDDKVVLEDEITTTEISETTSEYNMTDNSDETDGGNPETIIEYHITVQDDHYLYDNHEISFDDLKALLSKNAANEVVIISDEDANDQVYPQLIDYLDENNINYTEVDK